MYFFPNFQARGTIEAYWSILPGFIDIKTTCNKSWLVKGVEGPGNSEAIDFIFYSLAD